MKRRPLTEMSLDELNQKRKSLRGIIIGFGSVMLIAFAILLYLALTVKMPGLVVVAIGCTTATLPIAILLKQLDEEIKKRKR